MSLKDQLLEDMKQAMRDREAGKTRLSVIRMTRSAIRNVEIDQGKDLTDDEVIEVISREAKQKRETLEAFEAAGRAEKVNKLQEELDLLESYLPEQLGEDELRELARQAIENVHASGPADMGKVMGSIMPQVKGRADGSMVSRIVRELLQDQSK